MKKFTIEANNFLSKDIQGFYHTDYIGHRREGNPDYINVLKNTYNNFSEEILNKAISELKSVLNDMLIDDMGFPATVCVVPRAKTNYYLNQLLFKTTIKSVVRQIIEEIDLIQYHEILIDGTDYIIRHTNTKTTHLPATTPNYNNDGSVPYKGITRATCNIWHC